MIFKINGGNIEESFSTIAHSLFNKSALNVNGTLYRLTEIEFYYYNENHGHEDPYVHKHHLQKQTSGQWYFHGSGIDITIGDENSYGGILIRGILKDNHKSNIDGPLNVLTEVFKTIGKVKYSSLGFGFISYEYQTEKIWRAPRVGLNPKHDKKFSKCLYRYLIMPKLKHKDKNSIAEANNIPVEEIYA